MILNLLLHDLIKLRSWIWILTSIVGFWNYIRRGQCLHWLFSWSNNFANQYKSPNMMYWKTYWSPSLTSSFYFTIKEKLRILKLRCFWQWGGSLMAKAPSLSYLYLVGHLVRGLEFESILVQFYAKFSTFNFLIDILLSLVVIHLN